MQCSFRFFLGSPNVDTQLMIYVMIVCNVRRPVERGQGNRRQGGGCKKIEEERE